MSFPMNALNESQAQTTFLWKLAIEENQTKSENAPVLTVRGYSKMDWYFGRARGTKKMCQIIKNLLNRNLSLHPASIETSLFPKALSHSRSAGFRAAVPHGVLGCFYIKPNFPGRCSRTEQSKQMHIKTKQKEYRLEKRKYLAAKSSVQDTDEAEMKRTCFRENTDITDNFSRRWITS